MFLRAMSIPMAGQSAVGNPSFVEYLMTPEDIQNALISRGWQASIVSADTVDDLVDVTPDGLMKCVDGRLSDHPGMNGPKTLGGIYAIASLRGVRDLAGLGDVVREVQAAGHIPSVHGDDHAHPPPMGCGYFKLWVTGQLDGLEPPAFTAEEGRAAVLGAGGVYEELAGGHAESEVVINLVAGKTLEPKEDQRFVVDGWVTGAFNLNVGQYLTLAAQTVELLGGPRIARIVVDSAGASNNA